MIKIKYLKNDAKLLQFNSVNLITLSKMPVIGLDKL